MIVTENVTMYKCEHCPKRYYRKQDIVKHEFNCSRNPKNFSACVGCHHLKEIKVSYIQPESADEYRGPEEREAKGFYCRKLNQKMYPFLAVKKGLVKKYPETFADQIQMPTHCELYSVDDWYFNEEN